MNFETQLKRIASKSELHAMIDALPDDAVGAFIAYLPTEDILRPYYFPKTMTVLEERGLDDMVRRYVNGEFAPK